VRPRGRPPAARQVFSFQDTSAPLPNEVLLDTSYVVEALIASQPLHAAAVDFLVHLAEKGVRVRFSSLLELELAETAFQLALKEKHPKDWRRFRHDGRARRRATRLMTGVRDAWREVLGFLDHSRIAVDDVTADVPCLMSRYGLASYDAVHAATALQPEPVGIVTTDVGFCALPTTSATIFTAFVVAQKRALRACRRMIGISDHSSRRHEDTDAVPSVPAR
jgi:predicted nucleic acid-binding protein